MNPPHYRCAHASHRRGSRAIGYRGASGPAHSLAHRGRVFCSLSGPRKGQLRNCKRANCVTCRRANCTAPRLRYHQPRKPDPQLSKGMPPPCRRRSSAPLLHARAPSHAAHPACTSTVHTAVPRQRRAPPRTLPHATHPVSCWHRLPQKAPAPPGRQHRYTHLSSPLDLILAGHDLHPRAPVSPRPHSLAR